MGGTTIAHRPIRRDWCAFFMSNFDEPTIEGLLTRTGLYARAEEAVRKFAQGDEVNQQVSDLAEEVGAREIHGAPEMLTDF